MDSLQAVLLDKVLVRQQESLLDKNYGGKHKLRFASTNVLRVDDLDQLGYFLRLKLLRVQYFEAFYDLKLKLIGWDVKTLKELQLAIRLFVIKSLDVALDL